MGISFSFRAFGVLTCCYFTFIPRKKALNYYYLYFVQQKKVIWYCCHLDSFLFLRFIVLSILFGLMDEINENVQIESFQS